MSTLTWITEKELEQVIKNKRGITLEEKHENFIAAVRQMRNANGQQGENERQ